MNPQYRVDQIDPITWRLSVGGDGGWRQVGTFGSEAAGDDLPDPPPLRALLFGTQFASIPDGEYGGICCSGLAPMQRLGQKLIALGLSPNRKLSIERGGVLIGSTTIGAAANGANHE
jgi:hypothetical protein